MNRDSCKAAARRAAKGRQATEQGPSPTPSAGCTPGQEAGVLGSELFLATAGKP